ncbi:hypothetical protein [Mycobacterium tuberculosis]|uniref:hypothetical protein n=1 Tax=Mycobacterium tuberculosis TaxID=1773 RepID=UPI000D37564B|nr:hypothetical protein [Mycobacterium tuberculosis]
MSILTAERMAGYREGVSTVNQVAVDQAHEEGRRQGWSEAEADRQRWGRLCFLCGIAASALFYGLVLS